MKNKKLSYYQFDVADYLTGNIMDCSLEAQGLFTLVKCFYWQRKCSMTKEELFRKFSKHETLLQELITRTVLKFNDENLIIEFLLEQRHEIMGTSIVNSKNGKLGAEAKKMKKILARQQSENIIPEGTKISIPGTLFYVGMNQFKYPVSKFVLEEFQITIDQFMPTMNPITTEMVLKEMDASCVGKRFTSIEHVRNTFQKIARDLKAGKNPKNKFAPNPIAEKATGDYS